MEYDDLTTVRTSEYFFKGEKSDEMYGQAQAERGTISGQRHCHKVRSPPWRTVINV